MNEPTTPTTAAIDWDDYRLFATLARSGSVRRSASELGISHSTLSRRLAAFEKRTGAQLFERGTHGFKLTEAGGLLLERVDDARAALDAGHRALDGIDARMAGPLRVTMPDFLAYHLLLPAIEAFARAHPRVEVELDVSYDASDLVRREADVAVRMVMVGESPPDMLVGRKVGVSHATGYATPDYLVQNDPDVPNTSARWLGWAPDDDGVWTANTSHPRCTTVGSYNSAELQRHAAAAGLGMATIPCLIGDADPRLVRTSDAFPKPARDIWVLTHVDLRHTARMKAFRDAMVEAIDASKGNLVGSVR